jgi:16S rRNA processing protein RimM
LSFVEIGVVTRPHGVRGDVRIRLHWAESDALERVKSVDLVRDGKPLGARRLVSARRTPDAILVKFEGVDDRDAAERLRGADVRVDRDALPALEPGEYYLCDLIGARVVAPDGPVGEVVEVRTHPSVDTLVVKTADGSLVEQAIADPWIASVDTERRVVELSTRDGLI